MKKIGVVLIVLCSILCFSNCADSKTFTAKVEETKTIYHNGVAKDTIVISEKTIVAKPYGWANSRKRIEGVEYKVKGWNIFWDVVLSETIAVPIWLTGWQFFEPVGPEQNNSKIRVID
jgi:hypothetical protein